MSLPYTDFCRPLASGGEGQEELAAALRRASSAAGIRQVEVRGPIPGGSATGAGALRHVLALRRDPAEVYAGFHRSQVQRNIRRAEREELTVRKATRQEDLVGTFYGLRLRTRRRQGVSVQPRRFFRLLWENAISTGLGSVLIVETPGRPVAAAVFLACKGTVVYKFAASDARPGHCARTICSSGARSWGLRAGVPVARFRPDRRRQRGLARLQTVRGSRRGAASLPGAGRQARTGWHRGGNGHPRLPEFRKLRAEIDPAGALASDLSRRLGL